MMTVTDSKFENGNVQLDGIAYLRCRFTNCNLVYAGMGPVRFEANTLENCRWAFAGPANETINFLRGLKASGASQLLDELLQPVNPSDARKTPGPGSVQ